MKSILANGFATFSALALVGGAFSLVIGCPYSDHIREAAFWLGAAVVTGLTVCGGYQFGTWLKSIIKPVRPPASRLAMIPPNLVKVANTRWLRSASYKKGKACNLRLPPDIFFARETLKRVERRVLESGETPH